MSRRTVLTIRVSRDGGRTWSRTRTYRSGDPALGKDLSGAWPPCRCARCAPQRAHEESLVAATLQRWRR